MEFNRQRYSADYYSGANVSITLGPCLLTQCAGVEFTLEQTKRPIFGYNSQYFDAIAKGIVNIQGQLYLNFISPRYLPLTIIRFYQTVRAFQSALDINGVRGNSFANILRSSPSAMNMFSALQEFLDIPQNMIPFNEGEATSIEEYPFSYHVDVAGDPANAGYIRRDPLRTYSGNTAQQSFTELFDELFNDEATIQALTRYYWDDGPDLTGLSISPLEPIQSSQRADMLLKQFSGYDIGNSNIAPINMIESFARPDQFGHPIDGPGGIDILVSYGTPFGNQVTETSLNYDHGTSYILKNVHFFGESQAIMADGKPIMEAYSFMCRNKQSYQTNTVNGSDYLR